MNWFRNNKNENGKESKREAKGEDSDDEEPPNPTLALFLKLFAGLSALYTAFKYYIYFRKMKTQEISFRELFELLEREHIIKMEVSGPG